MKNRIYILVFLFVLVSCTSRTIYKKPDDLISQDKMVDIWTDMYLASSAKNIKTKSLKKGINYVPAVLDKFDIDSAQFYRSNLYYTSKIDDYEKIFQKVEKRLKGIKEVYQPRTELDSILDVERNRQRNMDNFKRDLQ